MVDFYLPNMVLVCAVHNIMCNGQHICTRLITEHVVSVEYFAQSSIQSRRCIWGKCYRKVYVAAQRTNNRTMSRLIESCCPGYHDDNGTCVGGIVDKGQGMDQSVDTGAMVTVPVVIVILMFLISILMVYLLYTKGKSCYRLRDIIQQKRNQSVSSETAIISSPRTNSLYCEAAAESYMGIEKDPNSTGLGRYDSLGKNLDPPKVLGRYDSLGRNLDPPKENEYEDVSFRRY